MSNKTEREFLMPENIGKPRKRIHSLQMKSLFVIIFAFLAALIVFTLIELIGTFFIENVYLSGENSEKRLQKVLGEFRDYVQEENLSVRDMDAVTQWSKDKLSVTIGVYDGETLLYNTDGSFLVQVVAWNEEGVVIEAGSDGSALLSFGNHRTFPVAFADGRYTITITEYSEMLLTEGLTWLSLGLGLFSLIFCLIFFNNRIVGRIVALSRELSKVQTGDMSMEIHRDGSDEITALGDAADAMRRSIILHYEKEQEALRNNQELLTSLSHDIRTPLTSLMIYTDAIADGSVQDPEELREYAGICRQKVHQLKHLTDTLFRYFLVFGGRPMEVQKETFRFSELIPQLLDESLFDLAGKGITVETSMPETDCVITVDPSLLKRVLDNLFSNLEKYADRTRPITLTVKLEKGRADFLLQNYAAKKSFETESSRIGLRTCEKLMELLGGSFARTVSEEDRFTAIFSLPIEPIGE